MQDTPGGKEDKDEATKEEYAIAKWMRKNVAIKKTKFLNHTVEYFIGECFCVFGLGSI